jgi:hypothetical protein
MQELIPIQYKGADSILPARKLPRGFCRDQLCTVTRGEANAATGAPVTD